MTGAPEAPPSLTCPAPLSPPSLLTEGWLRGGPEKLAKMAASLPHAHSCPGPDLGPAPQMLRSPSKHDPLLQRFPWTIPWEHPASGELRPLEALRPTYFFPYPSWGPTSWVPSLRALLERGQAGTRASVPRSLKGQKAEALQTTHSPRGAQAQILVPGKRNPRAPITLHEPGSPTASPLAVRSLEVCS